MKRVRVIIAFIAGIGLALLLLNFIIFRQDVPNGILYLLGIVFGSVFAPDSIEAAKSSPTGTGPPAPQVIAPVVQVPQYPSTPPATQVIIPAPNVNVRPEVANQQAAAQALPPQPKNILDDQPQDLEPTQDFWGESKPEHNR